MKERSLVKYIKVMAPIPFLVSLLFAGNALSLPCNGETADLGETMKELAAKCGEAAFKEQRTVTVEETNQDTTRRTTTVIDVWMYDRGPEEPVQSYRFENGKLAEITNRGYGTVRDFSVDTCRNGAALAVDDSTAETYLKCGDPIAKEKLDNKIIETESNGLKRRTIVSVAEWTYRYGPNAPGYTITFENGIASKIRAREFGK